MISVEGLKVEFGVKPLFSGASFVVNSRDRIALVGKNGAGKSTLLKILCGYQKPTDGVVAVPQDTTIGYLPQVMNLQDNTSVREEAKKAFSNITEMKKRIDHLNQQLAERTDYESDEYLQLVEKFSAEHERYLMMGAEGCDAELERTLAGLGFSRDDLDRPTREFSGGWRMRIELAKILLQRPDVLLLDEPTNHLDIQSIQWLEQFLAQSAKAVVLVSHDRAFINNVCNRTLEISCGKIIDYKVKYDQYVVLRKERREQQLRAYENQQKEIQEMKAFIDRFRYQATKAVQVQQKIKQLDKIVPIEVDDIDTSSLRLKFPPCLRSGDYPVICEDVAKTYVNSSTDTNNSSTRQLVNSSTDTTNSSTRQLVNPSTDTTNSSTRQLVNSSTNTTNSSTRQLVNSSTDTTNSSTRQLVNSSTVVNVFNNVNLTIKRGEKVAFVGKNGEGKSTLVKCIMNEIPFDGSLKIGHNIQIGYFAQNQAQLLDESLSVFETIDNVAKGEIRLRINDILGAFMFGGEASDKKVRVLSGGERSRLAMIKLLLEPVNMLILDEPTNHLDMQSKDVLKEAIRTFDGTAIIVSHDREFLDGLVDKVYEFGGGKVREHIGGIYDFLRYKEISSLSELEKSGGTTVAQSAQKTAAEENGVQKKQSYAEHKEQQKMIKRAEKAVADSETKIAKYETRLKELDDIFCDPANASNMQLVTEYTSTKQLLDEEVERWEKLAEELEALME